MSWSFYAPRGRSWYLYPCFRAESSELSIALLGSEPRRSYRSVLKSFPSVRRPFGKHAARRWPDSASNNTWDRLPWFSPMPPIILCCETIRCGKEKQNERAEDSPFVKELQCLKQELQCLGSPQSFGYHITGLRPFILTTRKAPREFAALRGLFLYFCKYYPTHN